MTTNIEALNELEKRMSFDIPYQEIQAQVNLRLKNIAKTLTLPGFRPGKVPMAIAKNRYEYGLYEEITTELIEKEFGAIAQEKKLEVAGILKIDKVTPNEDHSQLQCAVMFEVYPTIDLADIATFSVVYPEVEIGGKEIQKTLETIQKQNAQWQAVKRGVKNGDRLTILLVGKIDGEQVENTGENSIQIVIGEHNRIAEFDEHLLGKKAGQTVQFDITYPKNYNPTILAEKTVNYEVQIKEVMQAVLPELTDEFIKLMGVEDGTLDSMKAEIEKNLLQETKIRIRNKVKQNLFDLLNEKISFPLPQTLVKIQCEKMEQRLAEDWKKRGIKYVPAEMPPAFFDGIDSSAKRMVKLGLIMESLIRNHNLNATPEDTKKIVEAIAESSYAPENFIESTYAEEKRLSNAQALATEEKVIDWLLTQVSVKKEKVSFDDVLTYA